MRYAPTGRSQLVAANWSRPTGRSRLVATNWSHGPTGRGIEKQKSHSKFFALRIFFLYYQLFSSHLTIQFSKLGSLLHIHDLHNRFEGYTSIFKSNIVPTWQSKFKKFLCTIAPTMAPPPISYSHWHTTHHNDKIHIFPKCSKKYQKIFLIQIA